MKKVLFTLAFGVVGLFAHANTNLVESQSSSQNCTNLVNLSVASSNCFDFNDSCGGSWRVCHEGVSTQELVEFLFDWDGGC